MCWGLFSLTSHFKGLGEATEAHQRNSNFPFSSIVLTALQCISLQQFVCKRDRAQLTSSIASVELWWKIAPRVLFFLPKHTRMRPSHSLKLTGGGGFLGSMRTTLLSTLGGGLKLFLPTCMAGHTYHREIQQASECTDRSIPPQPTLAVHKGLEPHLATLITNSTAGVKLQRLQASCLQSQH